MEPKYIILLIVAIILLVVVVIIINTVKKFTRKIHRTISDVASITNTISKIGSTIPKNQIDNVPEVKTVGGATNILLPQIHNDFPDFHNLDAENDVKSVIKDYLSIIHGNKKNFNEGTVSANVPKMVSSKNSGKISNVVFHRIAIYNYQKTLDYATITYRCSVGYKLNEKQIETRYEVQYTLQLKDQGVTTEILKCLNCNAPLDDFNGSKNKYNGVCPYCNTKIIRDTIMSWLVSDIKEIP